MYSNMRNVQILIALLKLNDIKDIVLSPGGSDIPIIHSIETDSFFTCYSVVDERSAAYFAMGLAQAKLKPVACVCTSGTAVCNYVPGITEAYYQNVPIIAITCDKNPNFQNQLETQKISQTHVFDGVVKKSVDLPLINTADDEWLCNRLINEALLAINHHGNGPIQINIPIVGRTDIYDCKVLPNERVIKRYIPVDDSLFWGKISAELSKYKRILVVVGQNIVFEENDRKALSDFFSKYNCVFAVEHLSNLKCDGCVNTYPITEMSMTEGLLPNLVISMGNNLAAYELKTFLRSNYKSIENWLISASGDIRDAYKCLSNIIECSPNHFFKKLEEVNKEKTITHEYFDCWMSKLKTVRLSEFEFSNFYAAQELAKIIPEGSTLHLAILNSTRIMQFFDLADNVRVFSNVGALGIDGCMSTFAGQAAAADKLAFLVIGDLSFFYDMNAAGLKSISSNVRIILLNNGGGSEFHFFMGKDKISTINDYICAEHQKIATGWIASLGYDYYMASTKEEFDKAISTFADVKEKPQFIEVFTNMEEDANGTKVFYSNNKKLNEPKGIKNAIKSLIPEKQIQKAKKILKILKGE